MKETGPQKQKWQSEGRTCFSARGLVVFVGTGEVIE